MTDWKAIDQLVLNAKCGDKESFQTLWGMYQPLVMKVVNSVCNKSRYVAQFKQDLIHECYILFWEIINSFDFEGEYYFSYYLKRQAVKLMGKLVEERYKVPMEQVGLIDDVAIFHDADFETERDKIRNLRYAMRKLSGKQLQAVFLYYHKGLTQQQAAQKLGISQVGFRKRLVQSYAKMKKIIDDIG